MIKKSFKRKFLLAIATVISFSMILGDNLESIIFAKNEETNELGIVGTIEYSKDSKMAILGLDKAKMDIEHYEIIQILGTNGEQLSLANPIEQVDKNDEYTFTIEYSRKHDIHNEQQVDDKQTDVVKEDVGEEDVKSIEILYKVDEILNEEVVGKEEDSPKEENNKKEEVKEDVESEKEDIDKNELASNTSKSFIPQLLANSDSMIELNGQFNVSAFVSNSASDRGVDISDKIIAKINKNYIAPTIAGLGAYQGTSLTSKKTIDFSRSFKINGSSNQAPYGYGDGFLFAFHNDPSYKYAGGYSSNMAFYNFNDSGFQSDALIIEADLYNNSAYNQVDILADYASEGFLYPHLNVIRMNSSNPKAPQRLAGVNASVDDIVGEHQFELKWDASTKTISFGIGGRQVSYTGFDAIHELGTDKLYYTIGAAAGQSGTSGFNSEFTYDSFMYTDFVEKVESVYTTKDKDNNDITIPSVSSNDLINYGKSGDLIHIVHKLSNDNVSAMYDITEKISLSNSKFGTNEILPVVGTLKTYNDKNTIKKDIHEDVFHGEYTEVIVPPQKDGAAYIEYDVKLPDIILEQKDIETTLVLGEIGMSQNEFKSNAKIAGNPTLQNAVDLDLLIDDTGVASAQVIKQGIKGHTYDTINDIDLTLDQPNLMLDYIIHDLQGDIKTTIPMDKAGIYEVEYTLKDTRAGSNLISKMKRYIYVSDKHLKQNGIDIVAQNTTINEVELRQHKDDFVDFMIHKTNVQAYWIADLSKITNIQIDFNGFSYDSTAQNTPYKIKLTAEKNGNTAMLEVDILITPDVMGFLEIPSYVNLYSAGGIDSKHAGANVSIRIKDGITPGVVYDIKADTDFIISNIKGGSYIVSLYDDKKMPFAKDSEGKAILGSIDNNNRTKQVWFNIMKDYNRGVSKYEGTMTFYLSAH